MKRYIVGLGTLFIMCACSADFTEPSEKIEAVTDRTSYAPGDTIYLTLKNGSRETIEYGFCDLRLEYEGDTNLWKDVTNPEVYCRLMSAALAPNASTTIKYELRRSLDNGTYRLSNETPLYHSKGFSVVAPDPQ